jgi:hypothetical protein
MKFDKKDIPQFQKEVCFCDCVMKGKCIEEKKDDHWFLVCPKFFNWKTGYTSFVIEQLKWEREHPEEVEARHKAVVEKAKAWKSERKKKNSKK